jgi:hypothetical protein
MGSSAFNGTNLESSSISSAGAPGTHARHIVEQKRSSKLPEARSSTATPSILPSGGSDRRGPRHRRLLGGATKMGAGPRGAGARWRGMAAAERATSTRWRTMAAAGVVAIGAGGEDGESYPLRLWPLSFAAPALCQRGSLVCCRCRSTPAVRSAS